MASEAFLKEWSERVAKRLGCKVSIHTGHDQSDPLSLRLAVVIEFAGIDYTSDVASKLLEFEAKLR